MSRETDPSGRARGAWLRGAALAVAMTLLAGCATGYQDARRQLPFFNSGGYWGEPGPGELMEVGFAANGHTENDAVVTYLTWRCAELALQKHKPYMRIYPHLVAAVRDRPAKDINVANIMGGPADWVFVLFDDQYVDRTA